MTTQEWKHHSKMLTRILVLEHWDEYAYNLISELLKGIGNIAIERYRRNTKPQKSC